MQTTSNIIEILSPNRAVKLATREVVVRELSWLKQRQLLERISGQLAALSAARGGDQLQEVSAMLKLIIESEGLVEEVLTATTALTSDEVNNLTMSEALGLLDVALDLNVSSLLAGSKKIFGRIGNFGNSAAAARIPTSP